MLIIIVELIEYVLMVGRCCGMCGEGLDGMRLGLLVVEFVC